MNVCLSPVPSTTRPGPGAWDLRQLWWRKRPAVITEVNSPGFILINKDLQPVAFNSAALQILAYPTKSDHVHRPVLFLKDEIKTRLLKSNGNGDLQFAKDYMSGRRRYICRSFRLDGAVNTGESLAVCLLLERHCLSATEWSDALAQFDLT